MKLILYHNSVPKGKILSILKNVSIVILGSTINAIIHSTISSWCETGNFKLQSSAK